MLLNDFRHVCRADLRIPNTLGVNQDGRANRAKTNGLTLSQDNAAIRILAFGFFAEQNTPRFQFAREGVAHLGTVSRRAGLAGTNENMMPNRGGRNRRECAQTLNILNYFELSHAFMLTRTCEQETPPSEQLT